MYQFIDIIERYGLSYWSEDFLRMARPSFRIVTSLVDDEEEITTGSSKIGGTPDIVSHFVWPEKNGIPLSFVAQIRVSDILGIDLVSGLPRNGILYFFYNVIDMPHGMHLQDLGSWRIYLFCDHDVFSHNDLVTKPEISDEIFIKPCKIGLIKEETLPDWSDIEVYKRYATEDLSKYNDILRRIVDKIEYQNSDIVHRMFGYPDFVQPFDMRQVCQKLSLGYEIESLKFDNSIQGMDDWELLLQLDSQDINTDIFWGIHGRMYYWTRKQDLMKAVFDKSWLVLQSH